jgi:hypothetical protein
MPAPNEWPDRLAIAGSNIFERRFFSSVVNCEGVMQSLYEKLNGFFCWKSYVQES